MKKVIILSVAVLLVISSLVAGVFASYQTTLNEFDPGQSIAKSFVLTGNASDNFTANAKIAPGEEVTAVFKVQNYEGDYVTETDMALKIDFKLEAAEGATAIPTLKATMVGDNGTTATGTIDAGTGTLIIDDATAFTAGNQGMITYTVTISWPSDDAVDFNYQGENYGTAFNVVVTGTQATGAPASN